MPIKGGAFTWSNLRSDDDAIIEKLDHILFNLSWSMMLSKTIGCKQPTIGSDHCPTIVMLRGWPKRARRDFKFENKWLLDKDCHQIVKEAWENRSQISRGLSM
ncbi:hypothetical protein V6N11_064701 [Hibiscus sabdariffa]|uniref:Endonuclease/exonuclease/phosphatase domain-containing protein n=1 Tax=Hibiscus sabdariffa TaxID=183260 RepID=A0ABR2NBL1_9ROSI